MALYWKFDPLGTAGGKSPYFELTVATTADSLTWGFKARSTLTVDWGDGSVQDVSNSSLSDVSHTYSSAGVYTVKLVGEADSLSFGGTSGSWVQMITGCNFNWNALPNLVIINNLFNRAANLVGVCGNLPDRILLFGSAFRGATSLVIRMDRLPAAIASSQQFSFYDAPLVEINLDEVAANAPAGGWPGVKNIDYMFYNAGTGNTPGTVTGSQSAFLACFPNLTSSTSAFTNTNTTA